jgi:hypothetical protein
MMDKKLWKEIILLSVQGQPTKAVLSQTCMDVFFIRSVFYKFFAMLFFRNSHGPPGETPRTTV